MFTTPGTTEETQTVQQTLPPDVVIITKEELTRRMDNIDAGRYVEHDLIEVD